MNRTTFNILIAVLGLILYSPGYSQCSNFDTNYPQGVYATSNLNWITVTNCAYGGEFQRFEVIEGATYQFRTCFGTYFNSEITLWDTSHSTVLAYETDNCSGNQGLITWQATFTGEVNLLVSQNGCQSNTTCARVRFRMSGLPPVPQNNTPCNASLVNVGVSCEFETIVLAGAGASAIAAPACGNYDGSDIWYSAIVPASGAMEFSTAEGSLRDAVMAIYTGDCNSLTEIACSDDVNGFMPEIQQSGLVPGSMVYIRLFSYANQEQGTMDLCVYEMCTVAPSNDLVCNAEPIPIGSSVTGRNDCSDDTGESWIPSCWTGGVVNSVWYAFEVPTPGNVIITTSPNGDLSTQIALFSGNCASLTEIECNQSAEEGCGVDGSSSILVTGLTPGDVYYVMVDGQDDQTGYFDIQVSSLASISPQTGSDCRSPVKLCSDYLVFADPGPQGTGALCDFDGTGNCTGGERNSMWYEIEISASGDFNFTITPNDASNNSCVTETDYDFVLWKVSGLGETTDCGEMINDASRGLLACNYSELGVTGVVPGGIAPSPFSSCFDDSFEPTVSVTNGDVLLLVVQNYQGSTTGFTLDLTGSDPGVISGAAPSELYWTGSGNTDWDDGANWGNCAYIPACDVSAVIPSSASSFPELVGTHYVQDLTIETGATLKLVAGARLHICGDLLVYGAIDADPTSTILVDNSDVDQRLTGNLSGSNALGNLTIEKSGGAVRLYSPLEIKGTLSIANPTSVFRTQQKEIRIGGDFINAAGSSTFRGTGALSKIIFNGTGTQYYNQGAINLSLNKVIVDKPGGRLLLQTDLRIKNNTGQLELLNGIIETGTHKVFVRNPDESSLTEGNVNSYIEGTLRKYVNHSGLFHFPVGHSATGYQRADITFTSHGFNYLTVTHSPWATLPEPLNVMDCNAGFNLPPLNNGFFTFTPNTNSTVADYDISLFNFNYNNDDIAQGWTVMKDSGSGWMLDGNCVESPTPEIVQRTDLSGFSRLATIQASNPLPIELLSFTGKALDEGNLLEWNTASEIENQGFTIESSLDAFTFQPIGEIEGAGNSNVEVDYQFLDRNALSGITYYRLLQTDFDGAQEYSHIVAIDRQVQDLEIEAYPNPVDDILHIRIADDRYSVDRFEITDYIGQVVWKEGNSAGELSKSIYELDISELKSGHYTLRVFNPTDQNIYNQAIIKH